MMSLTRKIWHRRSEDELAADQLRGLAGNLGVSLLTARVLVQRGIADPDAGRAFLDSPLSTLPDPWLLPGMGAAVSRLKTALLKRERILVHGDYDVDGISGTALMVETLRQLGGDVDFFIPLRLRDGYGLSEKGIRQGAAEGVRLILSVDCGISAVEEAGLFRDLGMDLIVTDHHQPPGVLPRATALVNPLLPGNRFPSRDLSGVGVAFFLLGALRQELRKRGYFRNRPEPDLRRGLDLVALGTIADVVPLREVNRCLVRSGLKILDGNSRPGLKALRRVARVEKISCGTVGFVLAPRLNAAGRLEDAGMGVDLLLASDPEAALPVAETLDRLNRERQALEKETLEQALERLDGLDPESRHVLVLADERWHPGVIGIVASRLVERFHRPTLMIALENGVGKGSGRSIPGFHLHQGLDKCGEFLEGFGGHRMAAGFTLAGDRVEAFSEAMERVAGETIPAEDLLPQRRYDEEVLLEELTEENVRELDLLRPCGAGNPEPLFLVRDVRGLRPRIAGEKHLQFAASQGGYSHACIAFGLADLLPHLPKDLDLLCTPSINEWRGRKTVQLMVRDLRPALSSTA